MYESIARLEKRRIQEKFDRKKMKHLKRDYRTAPGVLALGIVNPKPVVHGAELMVESDDGICIGKEEATTPYIGLANYDPAIHGPEASSRRLWIPLPSEIEQLKAEARQLFAVSASGSRNPGGSPTGHVGITRKEQREQENIRVYPDPRDWNR